MILRKNSTGLDVQPGFLVVHPLDDALEEKVDTRVLGPMPMTTSVRLSLFALRGYLFLMMLLVLFHVLDLAGAFPPS
jgi:hypothetical protein